MSRNRRQSPVTSPQSTVRLRPHTARTGSPVRLRPHTARTGSPVSLRPHSARTGSVSPRRTDQDDTPRAASLSPRRSGGPSRSPQGSPTRGATQQELQTRSSPLLAGQRRTGRNLPGETTLTRSSPAGPGHRELSPVPYSSNVFVLQQGSNVLRRLPADDSRVPQIVVSDHADDDTHSSAKQGRGISIKPISCNSCTGTADREKTAGDSSRRCDADSPGRRDSLSDSLGVFLETRNRSRSMPSVVLPELSDGRVDLRTQRRPSLDARTQSTTPRSQASGPPSETDLRPPPAQGRRHSFTGVRSSLARGSISELWGSASERQRPVLKGGLWGKRGTMEMEQTLRALQVHADVTSGQNSSLDEAQWEELRKCRYLRLPFDQEDGNV